ncbi:MAG TPA: sigma-70 family RNA polymerase sigma factor [Symbiobacteriaceae bacterium]|nr:sigma-70 family RNA polymerase sigma factor [Symbiobacteriaceae bacterium]
MYNSDEQFLALLRNEEGKLLRLARALTGQDADAWDLLQEATLVAYSQFHKLRGGPDSFGPWIRHILVNRARNLLISRSRISLVESMSEETASPEPGPEEQFNHTLLWVEVMALEDHHRQVLTLRFLADMKVEEIAILLHVPEGTVKSRINRALSALRVRLESGAKGAVKQA